MTLVTVLKSATVVLVVNLLLLLSCSTDTKLPKFSKFPNVNVLAYVFFAH